MATLWHLAAYFWKKQKRVFAWIIIATATLLLVGSSIILITILKKEMEYYNDGYVEDYYSDDYESEEIWEYDYDAEEYAKAWTGPTADSYEIEDCFQYVLFSECEVAEYGPSWCIEHFSNSDSWQENEDEPHDQRLDFFLVLKDFINRENDRLLQFFYKYRENFYAVFPYQYYINSGINNNVEMLLEAHAGGSDYYNNLNPKLMRDLYQLLIQKEEEEEKQYISYFYGEIAQILTNYGIEYDEVYIVNAYAFWARRYHEHNSEAVYRILRELQHHYDAFAEESYYEYN